MFAINIEALALYLLKFESTVLPPHDLLIHAFLLKW